MKKDMINVKISRKKIERSLKISRITEVFFISLAVFFSLFEYFNNPSPWLFIFAWLLVSIFIIFTIEKRRRGLLKILRKR